MRSRHLLSIVMAIAGGISVPSLGIAESPVRIPQGDDLRALAKRALVEWATVCDAIAISGIKGSAQTIVASVDYSGRRFCNAVVLVSPNSPPVVLQAIDAWNVEVVSKIITDVNKDGRPELVIPTALTEYEGARACVATVPIVYECSSGECRSSVNEYRGFYVGRGDEVLRAMGQLSIDAQEDRRACLTVEHDKISRMLGIDLRAGFRVAEQWAKNPDPLVRRRAVAVLRDIGDAPSKARLQVLAADSDSTVSSRAVAALEGRREA
jgi:hypothetical protein